MESGRDVNKLNKCLVATSNAPLAATSKFHGARDIGILQQPVFVSYFSWNSISHVSASQTDKEQVARVS
jgi:hypothetical protein